MKLAKGVVLFFLMGLMGSCFNPPEFPIEPKIEFESLVFKKIGGDLEADSLTLTIRFEDGDGDLGIDEQDPDYASYPYHPFDYFLARNGELIKISTEKRYSDLPPLIKVDNGQSGKLVTVRTRNDPGYGFLPEYVIPFNCSAYNYDSVYVSAEDKGIFDDSYNIIDSLTSETNPSVYILLDTFYYEFNPNHYNITVKFETKNTNGTYTEFDWREQYCTTFDGRFPVLSETSSPVAGFLKYGMKSNGFLNLFGGKTLRLTIQIKDRSLHVSNVIHSNDVQIN